MESGDTAKNTFVMLFKSVPCKMGGGGHGLRIKKLILRLFIKAFILRPNEGTRDILSKPLVGSPGTEVPIQVDSAFSRPLATMFS